MQNNKTEIDERLSGLFLSGFDSGAEHMVNAMVNLGLITEKMGELIVRAYCDDLIDLKIDTEYQEECAEKTYEKIFDLVVKEIRGTV